MDITSFYYDFVVGESPSDENYNRTNLIISHLKDAGFNDNILIQFIINELPNKDYLTFEDIPDKLWENSLLERGKFYYHKELQIVSPAPTWDPITNQVTTVPFFLEMKIKYTEDDVLDYFIKTLNVNGDWVNVEKELGSIKYLLNKYKKFNFVEPIDFILHLIDYCASFDNIKVSTIYDLCSLETECAEYLNRDVKNAIVTGRNKVVWRKQ